MDKVINVQVPLWMVDDASESIPFSFHGLMEKKHEILTFGAGIYITSFYAGSLFKRIVEGA
jgi:hypothetical protein